MITLLISFFVSSAQASTSDILLKLEIGAKSKAQLAEALSYGGAVSSLKDNCSRELQLNFVPESCFREAKLEFAKHFLNAEGFDQKIRAYSSICKRVARESSDLLRLRAALSSDALTLSCRTAIKKRSDDLEYQIGEVRELDRFLN